MITRSRMTTIALAAALAVACSDPPSDPSSIEPSLRRDRGRDRTVVVDPDGRHDATTIQAGIDMAPAGGRVLVRPGTYAEALVINKGLTLEGVGRGHDDDDDDDGQSGSVIIAPAGTPAIAVQVATSEPVVIRDVTVHFSGVNGIRGEGVVDVTVERVSVLAVNAPVGVVSNLVSVINNAPTSGRARLVVRESFLDGAVAFANSPTPPFPQTFAIHPTGDVDAVLERNVIRRSGGACIFVQMRNDFAGQVDASIVGNDLDECYPLGRAAAILVAPPGAAPLTQPVTATGVVNIIGNTIRNTTGSCLTTTAIHYEFFTGRIEHNSIEGVVQPCATPQTTGARVPSAILVGSFRIASGIAAPLAAPVIRFNNIVGNAHAGLRVTPRQTTSLDARCNWWGSASGPSGVGPGTGDAIIVEPGAATPIFTPFATGPIAQRRHHGDDDDDDDDRHSRGSCRLDYSLWSAPVSLGATINTIANEQGPTLSEDGLSLYFGSDRLGGSGGFDIWVAERACRLCPWEPPANLGTVINAAGAETGPGLSADGHLLFLTSTRPGGQGGQDLYVSRRADATDNFGWGPPVSVGPEVNTAAGEAGLEYLPSVHRDVPRIFFNRSPAGGTADIYVAPATVQGFADGPAVLVSELSDPTFTDQGTTLRGDGREVVFFSTRSGGLGGNDLWTSLRPSVYGVWARPQNLGSPVNSAAAEQQPSLSGDGRTLVFASSRTGSLGGTDIWMSTRTRIGRGNR